MICPGCRHDNIEGVDVCANCGQDLFGVDESETRSGGSVPNFMTEPLAEIPAQSPVRVGTTDPVGLAVRLMQNADTDCLLVMHGTQLAGIITPWDILHKVAGPTKDLNAVTCGQIMTADPVFLRDNDDIAVALNKMSVGGFRHIPIIRDGRPTGVVTARDVFHHLAETLP